MSMLDFDIRMLQAQCWPPLLMGRDVIGIAMTGSGKTLTFLVGRCAVHYVWIMSVPACGNDCIEVCCVTVVTIIV